MPAWVENDDLLRASTINRRRRIHPGLRRTAKVDLGGPMSDTGIYHQQTVCKLWNDESSYEFGKSKALPEVH